MVKAVGVAVGIRVGVGIGVGVRAGVVVGAKLVASELALHRLQYCSRNIVGRMRVRVAGAVVSAVGVVGVAGAELMTRDNQ